MLHIKQDCDERLSIRLVVCATLRFMFTQIQGTRFKWDTQQASADIDWCPSIPCTSTGASQVLYQSSHMRMCKYCQSPQLLLLVLMGSNGAKGVVLSSLELLKPHELRVGLLQEVHRLCQCCNAALHIQLPDSWLGLGLAQSGRRLYDRFTVGTRITPGPLPDSWHGLGLGLGLGFGLGIGFRMGADRVVVPLGRHVVKHVWHIRNDLIREWLWRRVRAWMGP